MLLLLVVVLLLMMSLSLLRLVCFLYDKGGCGEGGKGEKGMGVEGGGGGGEKRKGVKAVYTSRMISSVFDLSVLIDSFHLGSGD